MQLQMIIFSPGHLYPTLTTLMRDSDSEVRNNAIFGIGELVVHGRELLYP